MNESYINRIIDEIGEDLFPFLGKISKFKICQYDKLTFSSVYRIKITYNDLTKRVVLKKYIKEKRPFNAQPSVESEYNILNYLYNKFSSLKGINVIRPITFLADEDIIVTEEFMGERLNVLIVDQLRWFTSSKAKAQIQNYFFQCGRWLRYFQKFTKKYELIPFRKDSYIKIIESKLPNCERKGLKRAEHEKIYYFIDHKFKKIGDQKIDMVGYHSDFTQWNILARDDEIRVLDFDRFSYRNRYDDLTRFLTALDSEKSVVGMLTKNIDTMKEAFMKGYGVKHIDRHIFELHLLKNNLKALNMIDIEKRSNIKFFDVQYEKYRKKKQIGSYLKVINSLISN